MQQVCRTAVSQSNTKNKIKWNKIKKIPEKDGFSFKIIITLGVELPGYVVYPEEEELYNASSAVKMHRPCALSPRLMMVKWEVSVSAGGKKEPFVMAEGVERMHHFAKNKQGLKTLELQSPNLSNFPGPKSIHFISLFFFSFCVLPCLSCRANWLLIIFRMHILIIIEKKNAVFVHCLRLFLSSTRWLSYVSYDTLI